MANFRQIHTLIWRDPWFSLLENDAKLVWIYLFSNESSKLCGLYEITVRQIVFDCALSQDKAKDILASFEADGKIMYQDNVMWVRNMERYHSQGSPRVETRKRADVAAINSNSPVKIAYVKAHGDTVVIDSTMRDAPKALTQGKPDSGDAYAAYERNVGALTPIVADSITDAVDEYTSAWVVEAIAVATRAEKRNWAYIQGILKRWKRDGFNSDKKKEVQDNGIPAGIVYGGS